MIFAITTWIITLGLAIAVHREVSGEFPFQTQIVKLASNIKRFITWTLDMISAMVIMALVSMKLLHVICVAGYFGSPFFTL